MERLSFRPSLLRPASNAREMCECGMCHFGGGGYFDQYGYDSEDGYGYGYGSDSYDSDQWLEEEIMAYNLYGGGRKAGHGNAREKSDKSLLREFEARDKFKELADATPINTSGFQPLSLAI